MAKTIKYRSRGIKLEETMWDYLAVEAKNDSRSVNGQVEYIINQHRGKKK